MVINLAKPFETIGNSFAARTINGDIKALITQCEELGYEQKYGPPDERMAQECMQFLGLPDNKSLRRYLEKLHTISPDTFLQLYRYLGDINRDIEKKHQAYENRIRRAAQATLDSDAKIKIFSLEGVRKVIFQHGIHYAPLRIKDIKLTENPANWFHLPAPYNQDKNDIIAFRAHGYNAKAANQNAPDEDEKFHTNWPAYLELKTLLAEAHDLIETPPVITEKTKASNQKIITEMLTKMGLPNAKTLVALYQGTDFDMTEEEAQDSIQAVRDVLTDISNISPETFLALYRRSNDVERTLQPYIRVLQLTNSDQVYIDSARLRAYMYGFSYALARAETRSKIGKGVMRGASVTHLDSIENDERTPENYDLPDDQAISVILPKEAEKVKPPSSEPKRMKKRSATAAPAPRQKSEAEIIAEQRADLAAKIEQTKDEIALENQAAEALRARIEEMDFEYGWQPLLRDEKMEIYQGLMDELKSLHQDHDELAQRLREKGSKSIPALDEDNRLSGNEVDNAPLKKPDLSAIMPEGASPKPLDKAAYKADDKTISVQLQQLEDLHQSLAESQSARNHIQAQHDALQAPLVAYQSDTARLERLIDTARQRIAAYRVANQCLVVLDDKTSGDDFEGGYPPLSMLGDWAAANLKGRVVIHPDALEVAADIDHNMPEVIYGGLSYLANEYFDMKKASPETIEAARLRSEEALENLSLENRQSTRVKARRKLGDYFKYIDGQEYFMDRHLVRGKSFEDDSYVRIYFTWDDAHDRVVVGHLPTHLKPTVSGKFT